MFKLFKRVLAYLIDMMVVLIIVQTIASIPFINKSEDKYNKVYENYMTITSEYTSFKLDLVNKYEDNKLTSEEYEEVVEDNSNYKELLDDYYDEEKGLSKKNYNKLLKKLDSDYESGYKEVYYKLDKYNMIYNVSYIIVTFLYFVIFNMITGGVTLGKKLMRLKIVNNKDSSEGVSIFSYIVRFIMLYQPIYYLARLISVNILGVGSYYDVLNTIYTFHTYLEFVIVTFVIVRLDGRGLHDIISKTKVIALDRLGNEIESKKEQL